MRALARNDELFLYKYEKRLRATHARLKTARKYYTTEDKEILLKAIDCYAYAHEKYVGDIIAVIGRFPKVPLTEEARSTIIQLLEDLFEEQNVALAEFQPQNDNERFNMLNDITGMRSETWAQLCKFGVCLSAAKRRFYDINGIAPESEFIKNVVDTWGFVEPKKYFHYFQVDKIPYGVTDGVTE